MSHFKFYSAQIFLIVIKITILIIKISVISLTIRWLKFLGVKLMEISLFKYLSILLTK